MGYQTARTANVRHDRHILPVQRRRQFALKGLFVVLTLCCLALATVDPSFLLVVALVSLFFVPAVAITLCVRSPAMASLAVFVLHAAVVTGCVWRVFAADPDLKWFVFIPIYLIDAPAFLILAFLSGSPEAPVPVLAGAILSGGLFWTLVAGAVAIVRKDASFQAKR
jgi:hypothetical protein